MPYCSGRQHQDNQVALRSLVAWCCTKRYNFFRGHDLTHLGTLSGTARFFLKEAQMAWFLLVIAGLLEIVWAFSMKQSEGFTRLGATSVTLVAMVLSFGLLSWSMRTLPLGTAYTVWTGIGAVGAFLVGIVFLHEPMSAMRILAAALIVGGLVLMKLSS